MTDSTSDVISIDRRCELMGAEADGEEQIAAVRDQGDAMAHFIVDVFLEQQAAGAKTTTPAAFDDAGSIPSGSRGEIVSNQQFNGGVVRRIEPRNFRTFNHL